MKFPHINADDRAAVKMAVGTVLLVLAFAFAIFLFGLILVVNNLPVGCVLELCPYM